MKAISSSSLPLKNLGLPVSGIKAFITVDIRGFYGKPYGNAIPELQFIPYKCRMAGKWEGEGKILKGLLEERNVKRIELAEELDVSIDVIDSYCSGRTPIPEKRRARIARFLGVNPAILTSGQQMLRTAPTMEPITPSAHNPTGYGNLGASVSIVKVGYRAVPVYGALAKGAMTYSPSDVIEIEELPEWPSGAPRWGRIVSDRAMWTEEDEGFDEGDTAFFEERQHEDGNAVHAFAPGEDVIRIFRRTPTKDILEALNPAFPPLNASDYQIRGVVMVRVRGGRHHKDFRFYRGGYRKLP